MKKGNEGNYVISQHLQYRAFFCIGEAMYWETLTHIMHEPQKDQYCYHDCKHLPEIRNSSDKKPCDLSYFILLFIFVLSALPEQFQLITYA